MKWYTVITQTNCYCSLSNLCMKEWVFTGNIVWIWKFWVPSYYFSISSSNINSSNDHTLIHSLTDFFTELTLSTKLCTELGIQLRAKSNIILSFMELTVYRRRHHSKTCMNKECGWVVYVIMGTCHWDEGMCFREGYPEKWPLNFHL